MAKKQYKYEAQKYNFMYYLNSFVTGLKESSKFMNPTFWNISPVNNIPIKAGSVVKLTNHPPKCAQMVSRINWNNCPPGAADSPIIEYATPQVKIPINVTAIILENWRYVGQNGYGHRRGQRFGCQEGWDSLPRHRTQNVYHHDL